MRDGGGAIVIDVRHRVAQLAAALSAAAESTLRAALSAAAQAQVVLRPSSLPKAAVLSAAVAEVFRHPLHHRSL